MKDTQGVLGHWVRTEFPRLRFFTLSVWASDQAVADFVRSGAHREAMDVFGEIGVRGSSGFVRWKTSEHEETTWEEAAKRLAALGIR